MGKHTFSICFWPPIVSTARSAFVTWPGYSIEWNVQFGSACDSAFSYGGNSVSVDAVFIEIVSQCLQEFHLQLIP
jgi:hypothetical protein